MIPALLVLVLAVLLTALYHAVRAWAEPPYPTFNDDFTYLEPPAERSKP